MPKSSRQPTLLQDVGAIADLYIDVFRLMGKRLTGHSPIVMYSPPEETSDLSVEEARQKEEAEAVHAHAHR